MPVELPPGGESNAVPVDPLHPPVPFPEGVDIVDLLVVIGELLNELVTAKATKVGGIGEFSDEQRLTLAG